jgi:hypothetical protein
MKEIPGTAQADAYLSSVSAIDSGSTPLEKIAAGYEPIYPRILETS